MSVNNKKNLAKEALLELEQIKGAIKEESKDALKSLLAETVKDVIRESIDDEDDYDVVDDTDEKETEDTDVQDSDTSDVENIDGAEDEGEAADNVADTNDSAEGDDSAEEDVDAQEAPETGEGEDDEWNEYSDYQVGDDTYDFTGVEDYDQLVKVYKLMKDDDTVVIKKDGGKIELKDNETGAEYVIDVDGDSEDANESEGLAEGKINEGELDNIAGFPGMEDTLDSFENGGEEIEVMPGEPESEETSFDAGLDDQFSGNNNFNFEGKKSKKVMKENKEMLFEVDLGYTDNYQDKDPISGLNNNEPSKSGKSWEKGVPTGTAKPWAGSSKDKGEPFKKTVKEGEVDECGDKGCAPEEQIEESAAEMGGRMGAKGRMTGTKSHNPMKAKENSPENQHHVSTQADYKAIAEAYKKENKALKECIVKLNKGLKEQRVTNLNLAKITKLFVENTVTREEKINIVNRFSNEAKTVEQSNQLYENIKKQLNKKPENSINENNQMTVNGTQKLNEEKTYKSKDLLSTLDLIRRVEEI
jgi:hypothetical protein